MIGFKQETGPKDSHKGFVWGFYVRPEYRQQAIGSALIREIIQAAREVVEQLTLTVVEENEAAISLYTRFGFVPPQRPPPSTRPSRRTPGQGTPARPHPRLRAHRPHHPPHHRPRPHAHRPRPAPPCRAGRRAPRCRAQADHPRGRGHHPAPHQGHRGRGTPRRALRAPGRPRPRRRPRHPARRRHHHGDLPRPRHRAPSRHPPLDAAPARGRARALRPRCPVRDNSAPDNAPQDNPTQARGPAPRPCAARAHPDQHRPPSTLIRLPGHDGGRSDQAAFRAIGISRRGPPYPRCSASRRTPARSGRSWRGEAAGECRAAAPPPPGCHR